MIGDTSFKIKPRLGDYVLLNRNQGHLAKTTLFPCPHPVLGKGAFTCIDHATSFIVVYLHEDVSMLAAFSVLISFIKL